MLRLSPIWIPLLVALSACHAPPAPVANSVRSTFVFDETPQVVTLGPGDLVNVRVLGHPELSSLETGTRVDREGLLHLPTLDAVPVQDRSLQEVRNELQVRYGEVLRNAQVSVDLLENQSNRYYILGHVQAPGSKPLDRSLTALEATSAGGYFLRGADRSHIFVLRPHPDGLETHQFNLTQPGPEA
ncbi:MAG TPA: polysaccharide biosynthesis/export family protein, partial [Planctomycetota bacterium]|nr:polysaccharide biosynthesis/export family protein [Planctomycetota bacterium]